MIPRSWGNQGEQIDEENLKPFSSFTTEPTSALVQR